MFKSRLGKFISLAAMAFSMVACGGGGSSATSTDPVMLTGTLVLPDSPHAQSNGSVFDQAQSVGFSVAAAPSSDAITVDILSNDGTKIAATVDGSSFEADITGTSGPYLIIAMVPNYGPAYFSMIGFTPGTGESSINGVQVTLEDTSIIKGVINSLGMGVPDGSFDFAAIESQIREQLQGIYTQIEYIRTLLNSRSGTAFDVVAECQYKSPLSETGFNEPTQSSYTLIGSVTPASTSVPEGYCSNGLASTQLNCANPDLSWFYSSYSINSCNVSDDGQTRTMSVTPTGASASFTIVERLVLVN